MLRNLHVRGLFAYLHDSADQYCIRRGGSYAAFHPDPWVLLVLTGCGGQGGQRAASPDTTESVTTAEPSETTEPVPTETTEPAGSTEHRVGETVEFEDGMKMTVLGLRKDAPRSSYAAGGGPGDQTVVVTVKVTNSGTRPHDLSVFLNMAYGADGNEAEAVFDSETAITESIHPRSSSRSGRPRDGLPSRSQKDEPRI